MALSRPEILAVANVHPLYLKALKEAFVVHERSHEGDPAAFALLAPNIVGIAAGGESTVSRSLLEQLPNLKLVSVFGVGYDGIDVPAAIDRGVMVTHTPGVLTDDVADLAMGLMLAVSRQIVQADQHVRLGRWPTGPMPLGRKVSGSCLGIVGLGRIGAAIARRAVAFDMLVAYTARTEKPATGFQFYATVEQLAAAVDFLVVITPGGQGTRHLINASVLSALGPNGYLINVARGSVVDEQALIEALQDGRIAGAGLDVFAAEPHVPEALWRMPNVVLTPHMASATHQTRRAMADLAFANMQAGVAGQPLLTPVPECQALLVA
jgi:lactate dehydrogenase-like 2-hydroxyacid dehydrogenase